MKALQMKDLQMKEVLTERDLEVPADLVG